VLVVLRAFLVGLLNRMQAASSTRPSSPAVVLRGAAWGFVKGSPTTTPKQYLDLCGPAKAVGIQPSQRS
jgi:hypothetical protein